MITNGSWCRLLTLANLKRIAKVALDCSTLILTLFAGMTKSEGVILFCTWGAAISAVVALVVDFFHCRNRQAVGLLAEFPKHLTVTFFLMNVLLLLVVYAWNLPATWIQTYGGLVLTSGLFVGVVTSLVFGKPFVYAFAIEAIPAEKMKFISDDSSALATFEVMMRKITWVWALTFLLLLCVSVAATVIRVANHNSTLATIVGTLAPGVVVVSVFRVVTPRVIQKEKEQLQALFSAAGPPSQSLTQV